MNDAAKPSVVLAADRWPTNADLILDVARLGHIKSDDYTLDPTYGRGIWWKKWRPDVLITHDIALDGVDFRKLPEDDCTFDVVAFDPPYVAKGGRATSGIPEFDDRFGLKGAGRTPRDVQDDINLGINEAWRVLRPGGVLLVKCKDYVSGGKLWPGTYHTLAHALVGFDVVDRFEHIGSPGPQPGGRSQQHARRNLSTLFVFRLP